MNLNSIFRRFRRPAAETAPQATVFERRLAEMPGPAPGALPAATYDLMERDAMVQTALTVKRLGVLAADFRIEPGDASAEAARRAEFVEAAFARMEGSPATILDRAMDAFAKGWSVQESVYEPEGDRVWLAVVRPKDASLFGVRMDAFGRTLGLRLELPGEAPRDLPIGKFVVCRNRPGYGRPKGRSDLDAAYPHWQAKGVLLAAWRLHLERFASPTLLTRCAATVTAAERSDIARALDDLAKKTSIVVPSEVEVSPLAAGRDSSSAFIDAIDFHNREIARSILGQTLATDEGRRVGSLAMGKVHLQVMVLQLEAIRTALADEVMTEQVIRPLVELNFGPGPCPRFVFARTSLPAFREGVV